MKEKLYYSHSVDSLRTTMLWHLLIVEDVVEDELDCALDSVSGASDSPPFLVR